MNIFLNYTVGLGYTCDSSGSILYETNMINGIRFKIEDGFQSGSSATNTDLIDMLVSALGFGSGNHPSGDIYIQNEGNFSEYFNVQKLFKTGKICDINTASIFAGSNGCAQTLNICKYDDDKSVKRGCYLLAEGTHYVDEGKNCNTSCIVPAGDCRGYDILLGYLLVSAEKNDLDRQNPYLKIAYQKTSRFYSLSPGVEYLSVTELESRCGEFTNRTDYENQNGITFDSSALGGGSSIFFFDTKSKSFEDYLNGVDNDAIFPKTEEEDFLNKYDNLVKNYFIPVKEKIYNSDGDLISSRNTDTATFGNNIFSVKCKSDSKGDIDLGLLGLYIFNTTAMLVMLVLIIILAVIGFLFK
jgi:hypothetical protein